MTDSNLSDGPVLNTADASVEGMVGPGQEGLLDEFIQEQEAAQSEEPEKLLGKFNSPEDLARAYQQLERKLGQQGQDSPSGSEPSPETNAYTPEQATEIYGAEAVEALSAKGLDMAELMQRGDAGEDISEHYDTLAETFNVSRQMVENYVASAQSGAPAEEGGLTPEDGAVIREKFGGDQAFQDMARWAADNLPKQELDSYNAVVNSGNREAIEWALRAISASMQSPGAVVEPKMISGNAPAAPKVFESQQQLLDAMNKRNEKGERLYDVDEAYRQKVYAVASKSPNW